jgi:hypothetical protein
MIGKKVALIARSVIQNIRSSRFREGRGRFAFRHGNLLSQSEYFQRGIHTTH